MFLFSNIEIEFQNNAVVIREKEKFDVVDGFQFSFSIKVSLLLKYEIGWMIGL